MAVFRVPFQNDVDPAGDIDAESSRAQHADRGQGWMQLADPALIQQFQNRAEPGGLSFGAMIALSLGQRLQFHSSN